MANKPEVEMTYNNFAEKGAKLSINKSILATAVKLHGLSVSLAPSDKGQLRNAAMYLVEGAKETGFNSQGGNTAPEYAQINKPTSYDVGWAGSALDYDFYQEFGTAKMAAQPHWRPAGEIVAGKGVDSTVKKYNKDSMQEEFKKRRVEKKVIK